MSLCQKPYMQGVLPFGCGQCLPCRVNRRRLWSHRIMLESMMHESSSFVTLTYDEENLPAGGSLVPKEAQNWLKVLRKRIEPAKIRYFLVGEYGETFQRPHYHLALFGISPGVAGGDDGLSGLMSETWTGGFTHVGELTLQSAMYIAGYVTKKMTRSTDQKTMDFLQGRHPEFARMSLRPGIGALAMNEVAAVLQNDYGEAIIEVTGDVPMSLEYGQKSMPLGRYLRRKLREKLGFQTIDSSEAALKRFGLQMQGLFEDARADSENEGKSLRKILVDLNAQKVLNMLGKQKIYSSKGVL